MSLSLVSNRLTVGPRFRGFGLLFRCRFRELRARWARGNFRVAPKAARDVSRPVIPAGIEDIILAYAANHKRVITRRLAAVNDVKALHCGNSRLR